MKTYINIIIFLFTLIFVSCEDVIDVKVSEGKERLVIEASLDWEKGTSGNEQTIKLSKSSPYFDNNTNNNVTGASVTVTDNDTSTTYIFNDENDGTYTISNFIPVIDHSYTLEVIYDGETYTGKETMMSVTDINRITQSVEGGFDDELLEVNVYYSDPADEDNFYLMRYMEEGDLFPVLEDMSDEFVNGNEIHDFWEKEDDEDINEKPFEAGDNIAISLYGISQRYYNYMRLLIEQYDSGGDPFSSNAAQIKGNCINTTNEAHYPFGYFRVTQVVKATYTFQ
ncbi:DUF4249 domain-containing protein [Flavobacteriaceae bacterium XHP0103]|uniref:DUF4249 domain-containing protein n=1 Tax=Marixanthotalea marina TaxID=2844359 RepID=UPI002989AE4C|nr:DUF4249 domain-containing protein [Marixanthotalea marina]MBU3820633.1 DUF4249 domain-containing protein [Marixanthotalea marina]